jgi:hypothetical protein
MTDWIAVSAIATIIFTIVTIIILGFSIYQNKKTLDIMRFGNRPNIDGHSVTVDFSNIKNKNCELYPIISFIGNNGGKPAILENATIWIMYKNKVYWDERKISILIQPDSEYPLTFNRIIEYYDNDTIEGKLQDVINKLGFEKRQKYPQNIKQSKYRPIVFLRVYYRNAELIDDRNICSYNYIMRFKPKYPEIKK